MPSEGPGPRARGHAPHTNPWTVEAFDLLDLLMAVPHRAPGQPPPDDACGREATDDDDPFGGVLRFCTVSGAPSGLLTGWRLGVKDEIPVAGVQTTTGLPGVMPATPTRNAAAVSRCLAAGATVSATTTVSFPPVLAGGRAARNPRDPHRSPGGSSSGSAVAVASGQVDAALGTDGAGSVRIPAAWCGLVGLKPTARLVPLEGCADLGTNEIGPITRDVAQSALLLEALSASGPPDRPRPGGRQPYPEASEAGIDGLRVGVVRESRSRCSPATLDAFDRACGLLCELEAALEPVSVPLWPQGTAIGTVIRALARLADATALGLHTADRVDPRLLGLRIAHYRSDDLLRHQAAFLDAVKRRAGGAPLARTVDLRADLTSQVDAALTGYDLLLTPTTPTGPYELKPELCGVGAAPGRDLVELATANCDPLNLTGHPALTLPVGTGENGMPAGLQIAGRKHDEFTVYRAAFAIEQALASGRWRQRLIAEPTTRGRLG